MKSKKYVKKKYYSVEQAVKILQSMEASIEISDLSDFIRENVIHPVIYINSLPAYACVSHNSSQGVVPVGYCIISGYWNIGEGVLPIFETILRKKTAEVGRFLNMDGFLEPPIRSSWQYHQKVFQKLTVIPSPQPDSPDLSLKGFMLAENIDSREGFSFLLENMQITNDDFERLIKHFFKVDDKNDSLSDDTSLALIGAIAEMYWCDTKRGKLNQSSLISLIRERYPIYGFSQRNLEEYLSKSLKKLEERKVAKA